MAELNQINIRNRHYLQMVQALSEKLEMPPIDVVKTAIAMLYNKHFKP